MLYYGKDRAGMLRLCPMLCEVKTVFTYSNFTHNYDIDFFKLASPVSEDYTVRARGDDIPSLRLG